ncbi:protein Gawky isoform X2 [Culex quinquefasciatus]|uniref:protein Gawky isoform X2 n=1 Tax=Culex quinquefasciatus TaxID=7176 RepID=UPI0018E31F29|nr:protein Gawky isoform X2 [Culex quinquefasciatus]
MGAITNAIATGRESRQKIVACKDEQANNNINSHNVKKVNNNNNNDYTVNMICDFIDYLIKFNVNRSVSVVKMDLLALQQQHTTNDQIVVDKAKQYYESADETATKPVTSNGSYTSFDELLRLTERQRAMEATGMDLSRCLRLRGGGESSLNNGTSAWGSPPATAGTASWGAPQQQGGWGNAGPNTNQRPDLGKPMQPPQGGNGGPLVGPNNSGSNSWNQVVKPPLQPPPQQQPPMQPNQPGPPGGNPGNNSNQPPSVNQQQPPPQPTPGVNPQPGVPTQTSSAKLEHLNSMREALFAVDGWGCQHVNQDTQWDVPASPEPAKDAIKQIINNGTELWETNLRNGGQPSQQPTQKVPWCPQGNHGGTWGVDDDNNPENNSVWAGGAGGGAGAAALPPGGGGGGNGNPPVAGQPNWNQNSGAMWPPNVANAPPKKEPEWTGNVGVAGAGGNNWENRGAVAPPPPPHIPAPPLDMGNVDMRSMRPPGSIEPNREFRGDPRGISGRLNGNSSGMWEQHPMPNTPLNKMPPQAPLLNATGNQWPVGAGGPQNIPPTKPQPGWDEASPPANRRNISNMDEGSSLWGAPANMNRPNGPDAMVRNGRNPLGGNSGPIGPGGLGGPRLGGPGNQMKSDNMWGHGGPGSIRNGSWGDDGNVGNWEEKGPGPQGGVGGGSTWNEGNPATWNNNKKPMVGGGNVWPETSDLIGGEWGAGVGKPPNKHNPQDIIRSSKQFRILYEMGFKKEDIEQALRTANMSLEEAMEMLQTQRNNGNNMADWRRHDDHPGGGFEPPFSGGRFPGGGNGPSLPFPQNPNGPNNNNMPGGMGGGGGGGGNPNLAGLNSLSKANLQSYLNQAPPSGPGGPFNQGGPNGMGGAGGAGTGGGLGGQNSSAQPSTQQLRMLVQQIQMAVQAGYLNHQILNQPLAPQTLFLLNQLLNNIKQLQVTQNSLQRGGAGGNAQMSMIPKIKQQIAGLQNQIATQQAIYVKQQQQQQQQQQSGGSSNVGGHLGGNFHREQNDLTTLQNSLSEMGLGGKDPSGPYHHGPGGGAGNSGGGSGPTSQQSRLNQWKLPAMDKDSSHDLTDFSRAPGTTAKSSLAAPGSGMPGLGGLQGDNTWSTGRGSIGDGWPDSSADVGSKDWPSNQDSFTDLVPEFEPGKPWKGNQMKIEEDPTITPGSIARSPIASISIAKDSDLFAGSSKPSPTDSISLSSSTWSFNPNNNFTSSISKLAENKNTWSDSGTSDLWGSGLGGGGGGGAGAAGKAPRGPPPGLSAGKNPGGGGGFGSNGWNQRPGPTGGNWAGGPAWYSTWVLLKNLTAQIDGSTLRTLCMQHGPVQNFHLYLNHGIALCKYLSREEANKAQQALNNCVLGNTTICAESPLASEVQTILQHLGIPGGANNNNINNNNNGNINVGSAGLGNNNNNNNAQPWRSSGSQQANIRSAADTWGSGWPSSGAGANLWTPLDGPTERGTPSNLNSFLPENLLGGELN